jgi:hypothetical protein
VATSMRPSGVNASAVGLLVEASSRSSKPDGRVADAAGLPTIARAARPVTKATITSTTEILRTLERFRSPTSLHYYARECSLTKLMQRSTIFTLYNAKHTVLGSTFMYYLSRTISQNSSTRQLGMDEAMQVAVCELQRIILPRTPVNKGMRRGPEFMGSGPHSNYRPLLGTLGTRSEGPRLLL